MRVEAKRVREILAKHILTDGYDPIIDLEKSHGSWIVDERDGSEYLDMFSMFASGVVGYNHPYIIENGERLKLASHNKTTLSDIYNSYFAEFVETFSKTAIPDYLPHAFFIDGGSLAVENALKVAFDWKVRKNIHAGRDGLGRKIIHFNQAFHGRSGYTLSLTNTSDPRKTMYFPMFDWPRIDNPKLSFPITDSVLEAVQKKEKQAMNQIKSSLQDHPHDIAAIIIEPIQGEGGDNHFRDEFMTSLRQICDENEMMFIMDEVQTGVGITGKWWAHEHFTSKPDIITFGKKAQVCGMLSSNRVDEVKQNVFSESSRINSTFGGNLTDMVRFQLILEIITDENLLENAKKMGDILLTGIRDLEVEFPAFVTNARGLGLFAAFDLPSPTERDRLISKLIENKLMILPSGDQSVRFRPHLNVIEEDLSLALEITKASLKSVLN